ARDGAAPLGGDRPHGRGRAGRLGGQVVGRGMNGPRAVAVATNSGSPKSRSVSQDARRSMPVDVANSKTISWPSKAVGHSSVNGWARRAAKSVAAMAVAIALT